MYAVFKMVVIENRHVPIVIPVTMATSQNKMVCTHVYMAETTAVCTK